MKSIRIEKGIFIEAAATAVYAHLANIANHPGLQPLVVATQEIERGVDAAGHTVIHFFAIEQFRFWGILPYRNKIRVKMVQIPEEMLIIHEVYSFPNIHLVSRTWFKEAAGGGTAVSETLHITTPRFVAGFVEKTAVAAHEALLQNLKTRLQ